MTDQGKGHIYCSDLEFVQAYPQPNNNNKKKKRRGLPCERAARFDAEDQPQALWQIAAFAFTPINCFNFFLATSRPKIRL